MYDAQIEMCKPCHTIKLRRLRTRYNANNRDKLCLRLLLLCILIVALNKRNGFSSTFISNGHIEYTREIWNFICVNKLI